MSSFFGKSPSEKSTLISIHGEPENETPRARLPVHNHESGGEAGEGESEGCPLFWELGVEGGRKRPAPDGHGRPRRVSRVCHDCYPAGGVVAGQRSAVQSLCGS
jgi:hypothetical protein